MTSITIDPVASGKASRHDRMTIALHWTTAVLVVAQFASAHIWEELERGTALRKALVSTHISLGILLAATILLRLIWRTAKRGSIPPAVSGLQHLAASAVHLLLYGLLVLQAGLGLSLGWSQGKPLDFFGLVSLPSPFVLDATMRHTIGTLHNEVAWILISLAGFHAVVALAHHYLLGDTVLLRMIPSSRPAQR